MFSFYDDTDDDNWKQSASPREGWYDVGCNISYIVS